MRAYMVGIRGDDEHLYDAEVFATTAGRAKYERFLTLREVCFIVGDEDISFKHLTCRSLGDRPTPQERLQREADAWSRRFPIGTVMHYWSGLKEGDPTGTGRVYHSATVVCGSVVAWIEGARSCHSVSHVEAV